MGRFHHGRDDVAGPAGDRAAHAETDAPETMVARLLGEVGRRFYKKETAQRWLQDQKPLLEALTWPAVWLNQRGVGLPVADYEAKIRTILDGVSRHGDLGKVRFFPAYLGDCIRKHFKHQGDELYEARKHVRNAMDFAFLKGGAAKLKAADAVPALAAAHAVLATARRPAKTRKDDDSQGSLF